MPGKPQRVREKLPVIPRATSKEATRAALVSAAIDEFGERGLEGPSLDDISARAGYTRGAFYVHFGDREALIVAVMDEVLGRFITSLLAGGAASNNDDLIETIRTYMRAATQDEPALHGTKSVRFHHLVEACRRFPAVGARYRMIVLGGRDLVVQSIERGQKAGTLRKDLAATALADLLVSAAIGIAVSVELDLAINEITLGETMIGILRG